MTALVFPRVVSRPASTTAVGAPVGRRWCHPTGPTLVGSFPRAVLSISLAMLVALCQASLLDAQGLQLCTLVGTVQDASGAALAAAEIEVTSRSSIGGPRRTRTDALGRYRVLSLPPGTYRIRVQFPGLANGLRENVEASAGSTMTIDVTMATVAAAERVDVSGPLVDVTNAAMVTTIDSNFLNDLPTNRSFADLINLAPGVTRGVGFGGTILSNALYVDGVSVTEPRRQQAWVAFPYQWMQELTMSVLGADVTHGESTGVTANAVLRAGGNQFHGAVDAWLVRPNWAESSADVVPRRILSWWQVDAQHGGPIRRDRVWYFTGFDYHWLNDRPSGFTGPGERSDRTGRALGRLTAAARGNLRLEGFVARNTAAQEASNVGPTIPLDVSSDVRQEDWIWSAKATWTRGAQTLIEASLGGYDSFHAVNPHPPNSRVAPSPRLDFRLGLTGNARSYSDEEPRDVRARIVMTRVVESPAGTHQVKAGVEHAASRSEARAGIPGDIEYRSFDGTPIRAYEWHGNATTATGRRTGLWLQDQWQIGRRVSLTAGLRTDHHRASVPGLGQVFETTPLAPRVGLAWDVNGRHATVFKAHYGRYADSLLLNRVAFVDTTRTSPEIFLQPMPDGTYVEAFRLTPSTDNRAIDPGISHSFVDQVVVGLEQKVARRFLLQALYIGRQFDNFMSLVDSRSEWIPTERLDPGPDGQAGTADDVGLVHVFKQTTQGNEFYFYTNPEGAFRRYDGIQFVVRKTYGDGWQAQASVTRARTDGTIGNTDFTNAGENDTGQQVGTTNPGVFLNPNAQINAEGRAQYDFSEVKLLGSWRAPWGGFLVSGVFRAHSGTRWERQVSFPFADLALSPLTVRVERRGSRVLPSVRNLDLRVEKTMRVPAIGGTFGVYADLLNATNRSTPRSVFASSGSQFGLLGNYTDPRLLRVAARLSF